MPGIGPVDTDDIVKGYEYEKDAYVLLDDEELDQIKIDSRKVIDLVQFVDAHEIEPIYFEKPYYVVPDGDLAEDGFIVIREALRRTRQGGPGPDGAARRRDDRGGQALRPRPAARDPALCRRGAEVRLAVRRDRGRGTPTRSWSSLAEELIQRKAGPFDATAFRDNYRGASAS